MAHEPVQPLSPTEAARVEAFVTGTSSPLDFASEQGMSLGQFIAWFENPHTHAAIAAHETELEHAQRQRDEALAQRIQELLDNLPGARPQTSAPPPRPRCLRGESSGQPDTPRRR